MSEKGYSLIEVLISLLLLSIIAIIVLPLIKNSNYNFLRSKDTIEMGFLGETILEQLKAFDYSNPIEDTVLDVELSELIHILNKEEDMIVELPINEANYNDPTNFPYKVIIKKQDIYRRLWKISVKVEENKMENINKIIYETYILKPEVKQ